MIDEQVKVDSNGTWKFQVDQNLPPGTYKITLKGTDVNGNPVEKPYTFTVAASVSTPLPDTGMTTNILFAIPVLCFAGASALLYALKRKISFEDRLLD